MLTLPDVTLVCVETLKHKLMRLAMEDCLSKVSFGDVLLLTDKPELFDGLGNTKTNGHSRPTKIRIHTVPNWPSKLEWCRANWFIVPPLIRTSRILFCQWDAGIWNADDWDDEFLEYDFIGALWQWHPSKRVGNTGFCLKSTSLARFIYDRRDRYPCDSEAEDDLLCRKYRNDLEDHGFTWAPENLAHKFAFEGCGPNPRPLLNSHFGFHGAFNFHKVFNMEQLEVRANLMGELSDLVFASEYVRDSYKFMLPNPEVLPPPTKVEET
jgi:hypothetical protein